MSITVAKTNLAKLLAQENLIVESRNVETAYFDLNTRTLVLPELKKDISPEVQDLFISHECSHGLHTPTEEWNSAIESKTVRKGILNVVEDSRIESLIKRKYPGLKAVYAKAYNKLMEVDFFGLSKLDIETLNFVDRLNLYCKVGFIPGIEFSDSEQVYVNRTENTKSFSEVVQLSKDIEEFIKKEYEENLENYKQSLNFDDFKFEKTSSESESEDLGEEIRSEFDEFEMDSSESEDGESEQVDDFDSLEDLLESFTDEHSKEEMKSFYANDNRARYYVTMPNLKIDDYIVSHQVITERIKGHCPELFDKSEDKFVSFKNENIDIVSYLAKEFNLKKNASARKKLKIAKTGDLNNNKLYSYRFNDDIFKRSIKTKGEKSHSMIFYLDWSGSMSSLMQDTIKQLMCLILFCKKVNIPYEVYAFTSEYDTAHNLVRENNLEIEPLRLLNLFSHKMTNKEFIDMANILLSYDYYGFRSSKDNIGYFGGRILNTVPQWFLLGSTPLNHSIILSDKLSKRFKTITKTDIVSNIFLTDGESHGMYFRKNGTNYRITDRRYKITLRDDVQKSSQNIDFIDRMSETNGLLDFVKQTNDTRYFGFRLANLNGLRNSCFDFFKNYDYSKYWGEMKKSGCVKAHKTSFDEFFFVRPNLIKEDKDFDKVKETDTVNSIFKQFSKSVSGKHNNRIFLKKFIEFIS